MQKRIFFLCFVGKKDEMKGKASSLEKKDRKSQTAIWSSFCHFKRTYFHWRFSSPSMSGSPLFICTSRKVENKLLHRGDLFEVKWAWQGKEAQQKGFKFFDSGKFAEVEMKSSRYKQSSMRMRAGPGKSWPRRAAPRSGCSLVPAQIRMLDCCSRMSFHLWPLQSAARCHDTGRITFLRPAAMTTGRTTQSCTRFSDQNVYVTARSMWELLVRLFWIE